MADHKKPTQEELDAEIKKTLEEIDKPENEDDKPDDQKEDESTDGESGKDDADTSKEDSETTSVADKGEEDKSDKGQEDDADKEDSEEVKPQTAEERLKQSNKEALKLLQDKKTMDSALHEANNLPEPTEDELKVAFPEWEEMSATERTLSKESLINKRFREVLQKAEGERKTVQDWFEKVDTFIENPKTFIHNPDLEGKQEDFKIFAKNQENRGVSLNILIPAFLHQQEKAKVKHKGQMFETGTGGSKENENPKSEKLTIEEGAKLMKDDYKKFVEYQKAGKISTEIV